MDDFTKAYIICALWSSNDESDESGGDPMNQNYTMSDIDQRTLEKMVRDCEDFQQVNGVLLQQAYDCATDYDAARAGNDFWLTRNGHGAGFWDRDLGDIGEQLTKQAGVCKGFDLYIGDDNKIHGA